MTIKLVWFRLEHQGKKAKTHVLSEHKHHRFTAFCRIKLIGNLVEDNRPEKRCKRCTDKIKIFHEELENAFG